MIKLGILDNRSFDDYSIFEKSILSKCRIEDIKMIISGGISGTDDLSQQLAKKHQIPLLILYSQFKKYQENATQKRYLDVIKLSDVLISFWTGWNNETNFIINSAKKYNKKLIIFNLKGEEQKEFPIYE